MSPQSDPRQTELQRPQRPSLLRRLTRSLGIGQPVDPSVLLYEVVVDRARRPVFFSELGVEDSVDGRFDMIVLHMFAVLTRLKGRGEEAAALSQALFDTMFRDMDRSLREMGVSDMSVGKRVRAMADAFYGRVAAYEKALDDPDALTEAIRRNVYRDGPGAADGAARLAVYLRVCVDALSGIPDADIASGSIGFPEVSP